MRRVSTARAASLSAVLLTAAACHSHPVADDEIPRLEDADLWFGVRWAESFRQRDWLGVYDADAYRSRLITELGHRRTWTATQVADIVHRRIWIGGTEEQVLAAWGSPRSTTSTTSQYGQLSTWIWGGGGEGRLRSAQFRQGVVTSWTISSDR